MSSLTLLIDFPAVVKSKVLEKLDVYSILKLRKVCYNLRQFIDESPTKFYSCPVKVRTFGDCISIIMDSPEIDIIVFRPDRNGCLMQWRTPNGVFKEVAEMANSMDVFLREFETIMKHRWRPVLESFIICLLKEERVLEELTRIGCVYTDEVVFDDCTVDQIAKFLPFFNSDELNKIRIELPYEDDEEEQVDDLLNLQEIKHLEQWKNSKCVKLKAWDFCVRVQDFLHFEQVDIDCKMMLVQNIVLLKENFLTSSTLTSFDILIDDNFNEKEQLHASFGMPSLPVDQGERKEKWFFRIPNNREVLSVTFNMKDRFNFRRIDIQDVPKDAVIK